MERKWHNTFILLKEKKKEVNLEFCIQNNYISGVKLNKGILRQRKTSRICCQSTCSKIITKGNSSNRQKYHKKTWNIGNKVKTTEMVNISGKYNRLFSKSFKMFYR